MKILIVGHMARGSNSRSLSDGFAQAGHEVRLVDTSFAASPRVGSPLWISKRWHQRVTGNADARLRRDVKEATNGFSPDLVVAIKTVMFSQNILLEMEGTTKVHVSFDDVSNPDNVSPAYLESEHLWDAVVTTKRHNVDELEHRGVRQVVFITGAFDPFYHRLTVPFRMRPFKIGFIGAARRDRLSLPVELAEYFPNSSVVFGPRWDRSYRRGVAGTTLRPAVTVDAFTAAANSIQMGIVLLNSENRDTHTMRSYETPACGQLFIGQRTFEHNRMFDDGAEAIFFDNWEELWESAVRISRDVAAMERIAAAGYRRIMSGNNTYQDRARQILREVT